MNRGSNPSRPRVVELVADPIADSAVRADYTYRPEVRGKFLFVGDRKYWVKGVTYGTFRPGEDGVPFPSRQRVGEDFRAMSAAGINTIRTYTLPPVWLLDEAQQHGLRVMVGLAWEQHVTFLDNRRLRHSIERRVREEVQFCGGHPAILCYAVGNEIPPSIVRWHGPLGIERFIERLYDIVKKEDPGALVTYVNFPTTEYLHLPFLDLQCFNVYLEDEARLKAYLARLQNLAGHKPLLMAEMGLDSRGHGEAEQARQLESQIRASFSAGCAGAFVFSWTDEWHRGGFDIEDWDFGLCRRDRSSKPALSAVRSAYRNVPFAKDTRWPRVSVVVCTYNGARAIRDTLNALQRLDYPDYEVIVVNDGSTDRTGLIVSGYDVRTITTANEGLGSARNTGWQAATGEFVAYIDDDAYPDPHWLQFLVHAFREFDCAAVGGPAPAPAGDGPIADCVANAPGRPVHVLLTDTEAEHIPGCNMAFRRDVLEAIGGFDTRYRSAGDDVDICWRILERGWKIGFHAGALGWHHCRNSLMTYWRQQLGYGRAEALLEEKWPAKYNNIGHLAWRGRLYGKGLAEAVPTGRWRIYHGQWGVAPFQSIYAPAPSLLSSLPLMPEWYLVVGLLAFVTLLGFIWPPLFFTLSVLAIAIALPVAQAIGAAMRAEFPTHWPHAWQRAGLRAISAWLHLQQPLARLIGRLRYGLTPWRMRISSAGRLIGRFSQEFEVWSETWRAPHDWLTRLYEAMCERCVHTVKGGDFDAWDIEIRGGLLGGARALMAVEEHGGGKQMLRFRATARISGWGKALALLFAGLGAIALLNEATLPAAILALIAAALAVRMRFESVSSLAAFRDGIEAVRAGVGDGE